MCKISLWILSIILLHLTSLFEVEGQLLSIEVKGGVITGTPYGQAPEGTTGSPGMGLHTGFQSTLKFTRKLGLRLGVVYSMKSATYDTPISGKSKISRSIFGIPIEIPINLSYEGWASGTYDNQYLDMPFGIIYQPRDRFSYFLGGYLAYLIEGSHTGSVDVQVINLFNVNDEPFDQTDLLNTWDVGLSAGADFRMLKRLSAFVGIQFGMKNINTENPEGMEGVYRNIYLGAGLSYRLFKLF